MTGQKRTKPKPPVGGNLAAPLHGGYYAVRPGGPDGPEYFSPDLAGMCAAIERGGWLSVGGPGQEVLVARAGKRVRVMFRWADGGRCTLRPACLIPARA